MEEFMKPEVREEELVEDAPEGKKRRRMGWWKALNMLEKIVVVVFAVVFVFLFYLALDANKYAATVHVVAGEGRVGVNPTTERLDFGDLSLGTSAVRSVTIENGTSVPMFIAIFKTGSIADLMDVDQNYFRLAGGDEVTLEFLTYMPASAQVDATYDGRVYLFKIPTFGL